MPSFLVSGSIFPYKLFPGSILVLVFSPGNSIGTLILDLYNGFPLPLSNLSIRFVTALRFDSIASSCGDIL